MRQSRSRGKPVPTVALRPIWSHPGAIDATRTLRLSQFLGALGIEALGQRRVALMIAAAGGDMDRLNDWRAGTLRDPALAARAGVPNLGGPIQDALDALTPVMDELLANGVEILPPAEDLHAPADGFNATHSVATPG